jgi:hypothetical protein
MKNFIRFFGLLAAVMFLISSCKKNGTSVVVNKKPDSTIVIVKKPDSTIVVVNPKPVCTGTPFSAKTIIDDMNLAPDAALHGTEGLSWGDGKAQGQPMPVPAKNYKGEWFRAVTNWGQVYIPRSGSTATNTRCQIRNLRTYILKKDKVWYKVQDGDPQGAAFVENFKDNASIGAGARDEAANGGGISVKVGVGDWAGHNYHFWPTGSRYVLDTADITAVFTYCEARLIKEDESKADDRSSCKNLLQIGADWWLNLDVYWLPDWSANAGVGSGRSKWVTNDWQYFTMCTLPAEEISKNPPCIK